MSYVRKGRTIAVEHERRVDAKRSKVKTMKALLATYCAMGWDRPGHKCFAQVKDLRARIHVEQTALNNMGGAE